MSSDRSDGGSEASDSWSQQEESRLIRAMVAAASAQKAAFCCGGIVPIAATSEDGKEGRFDDVAGLVSSPPVVLRWDLPSGMYILKRIRLSFNTFLL